MTKLPDTDKPLRASITQPGNAGLTAIAVTQPLTAAPTERPDKLTWAALIYSGVPHDIILPLAEAHAAQPT